MARPHDFTRTDQGGEPF